MKETVGVVIKGGGITFSFFPSDVGDEEAKRHASKRSASPRPFYHLCGE